MIVTGYKGGMNAASLIWLYCVCAIYHNLYCHLRSIPQDEWKEVIVEWATIDVVIIAVMHSHWMLV